MENKALIIGSTRAGLQAAKNLADCGVEVHLIESKPFLGNRGEYLLPDYLLNTRFLEILKHPKITTWTNTVVEEIDQINGNYRAKLNQYPRYIDLTKCTACGECVQVCPITIPGTNQKAIFLGGQPGCAVIEKKGISPCTNACPAGIHVQGYVALIAQGRYLEAYHLIHDALPFPSVCGRVCNHLCETACTRSQLDQAVNLMGLKRYVADWVYENREKISQDQIINIIQESAKSNTSGKKVAVIGAGPAGLTAARDLGRAGHQVTVFDDNPEPGGMMRVGIPPHRISYEQLDWEIGQILAEGVALKLNTWVDDIPGLLTNGYDAVLIATGAHESVKVPIEGANHPDNWLSLNFLKKACLGEKIPLSGRQVIVLGGGDVAMDAARVAIRLGTSDVKLVCRGMRASFNEIQEAEEEGVDILKGRVFQRILITNGEIIGVECLEADVGDIVDGKRQFTELPGTEHLIPGDLVIWALGQKPDFSFLPQDGSIAEFSHQGIQADNRMMTTTPGIFTAGDVRRGTTFFVVDAVGEGHQAARAIHQYIMEEGEQESTVHRQEIILTDETMHKRLAQKQSAQQKRAAVPHLSLKERENNFSEVDLALGEKQALQEAGRCFDCGPCSECMACLDVCDPGAIIHTQEGSTPLLDVGGVILADDETSELDFKNLTRISGEDVISGSAAAFKVLKDLGKSRSLNAHQVYPPHSMLEDPGERIGLILCQCGEQISNYVNLGSIAENALNWQGIAAVNQVSFCCSEDGAANINQIIRDQDLNKLILAACSCCSLDQVCYSCTYQRLRCKESFGVFSSLQSQLEVEFINIREHSAWVHSEDLNTATSLTETLIRSAHARIHSSQRAKPYISERSKNVLILGTGPAGDTCSKGLTLLGIPNEKTEYHPDRMLRVGGYYQINENGTERQADLLVLAPANKKEQNRLVKAHHLTNGRFVLDQNTGPYKLMDFGVVICPPGIDPIMAGEAAAAQIAAWISRINNQTRTKAAEVDWSRCRACSTCLEVCGFGIPEIVDDSFGRHAQIDPGLCLGCGICSAQCPSGAITPGSTSESVLGDILDIILT